MQKITTAADLKKTISELEDKKTAEWIALRAEFLTTAEKIKPINIIKKTFKDAISAPDLKDNIINTAIGLTTGFVAKKTLIGKTYNPLKKLLGVVLEMTVANKIAKNADKIKGMGNIILNRIINSKANKTIQ
jgi:hypothetical protein